MVNFQTCIPPQEVGKNERFEARKKKFWFRKKNVGTDTEIGQWFQFPIPKPDFCCSLLFSIYLKQKGKARMILMS